MEGRETVFYGGCHSLRAGSHFQFGKDALNMESYGSLTDSQNLADFPIGFSVLHPIEDRDFPSGKLLDAAGCLRRRFGSGPQQGHVNVIPCVFDEWNHLFCVESLLTGERTEGGDSTGRINGACCDAVTETELPCRGEKLMLFLGGHVPIDFSPMLRAG